MSGARQVTVPLSTAQRLVLVEALQVLWLNTVTVRQQKDCSALFTLLSSPDSDIDCHVPPKLAALAKEQGK